MGPKEPEPLPTKAGAAARLKAPPPPGRQDLKIGEPAETAARGVATLLFDGYTLAWRGAPAKNWAAFSGAADESARESVQDVGPTPQGHYTIDPAEIQLLEPSEDWGEHRVRLQPLPATVTRMVNCFKLVRTGMYAHGGNVKGTHGCIELNDDTDEAEFFRMLATYGRPIDLNVSYAGERKAKYEDPRCPL